jgi:hypothetical protein
MLVFIRRFSKITTYLLGKLDFLTTKTQFLFPRLTIISRRGFLCGIEVVVFGTRDLIDVVNETLMVKESDLGIVTVVALPYLLHVLFCRFQHIAQLQQDPLTLLVQLVYL